MTAPLELVGAAMNGDSYDEIVALIDAASASEDRWVLNACILSVGHLARRFKRYPADLKRRLWARARSHDEAAALAGAILTAEDDLAHFKAEAA